MRQPRKKPKRYRPDPHEGRPPYLTAAIRHEMEIANELAEGKHPHVERMTDYNFLDWMAAEVKRRKVAEREAKAKAKAEALAKKQGL